MTQAMISVLVLSTILLNGKRIFPSEKLVGIPAERVDELLALGAIALPADGDEGADGVGDGSQDGGGTDADGMDAADKDVPLIDRLVAAIPDLTDEDYTGSGKPEVAALERLAGVDVTAADRDAAWSAYQEANATSDTSEEEKDNA